MKKKILFITNNIPTPGDKSNRVILDLAKSLSDEFRVSILFPLVVRPMNDFLKNRKYQAIENWEEDNVNITIYRYRKIPFSKYHQWKLFGFGKFMDNFVSSNGPFEFIHAHYLFPDGAIAFFMKKKYNIPYFLSVRSTCLGLMKDLSPSNHNIKFATKIIGEAELVFSTNTGYAEYIKERYSKETRIIPHGIDKLLIEDIDIGYNSLNSSKLIITSIVFEALPTKNIDWVIKAVLRSEFIDKINLQIVGIGSIIDELKTKYSHHEFINFLGLISRDEVLHLLSLSDIFALPSQKETFGMVYLEAAARKNAIIAFKGQGIWGVFEDKKEALFCENYSQFENLLHKLIKNTNQVRALQKNAFRRSKKMTWEQISDEYIECYNSVLKL